MKISVVTVVWDNPLVGEALASILGQVTRHEVELVVVDGGSGPETLDAIAPYRDRIAHFVSEPDQGIYDAMNKGIGMATGDVIGTLNADDLYMDEHVLEKVGNAFLEEDAEAIFADLVYVDPVDTGRVVRYWKTSDFRPGCFATGWVPPHPTFYVRRSVYERHGRFDLDFRLAADMELMLRFLEVHRIRAAYRPGIWVRMRLGGATNKSLRNILRGNEEIRRAFRKNGVPCPPWFWPAKIFNRIRQFVARPPVR